MERLTAVTDRIRSATGISEDGLPKDHPRITPEAVATLHADPTLPCFYDCHLCATSAPVAALPPSLSGQMQIDRATIPDPVSGPSVVPPWCVLCGVGLWKIALPKKKKSIYQSTGRLPRLMPANLPRSTRFSIYF